VNEHLTQFNLELSKASELDDDVDSINSQEIIEKEKMIK